MKTLKRCSIQLVALLGLLLLAACAASSPTMATEVVVAPTTTSTSVPPTNTPRPTETPFPTQTSTPTRVPTRTPVPTIVGTPYVLTAMNPTNQQIAQLLNRNWANVPLGSDGDPFNQFTRQNADLDHDRLAEIVVAGRIYEISDAVLYFAVLKRINGAWEQVYIERKYGHYCGEIQAAVETDHVVVNYLTCGGGTGALLAEWQQDWIRCDGATCRLIWNAQLVETSRWTYAWVSLDSIAREYRIAQVERPDTNTIRVVTRYLSNQVPILPEKPISLTIPSTMRRTIGPDVESIYHWDGQVFRLAQQSQIAPGIEINRVFDQATAETVRLVNNALSAPLRDANGGLDSKKYDADLLDFWGPQAARQAVDDRWVQTFANATAHTGTAEELGEWIGAVSLSEKGQPYCLLSVHQHVDNGFRLVGNIDFPCTLKFTRLAWVDVTNNGQPELLLTTFPPDDDTGETGAGIQRLYVYAVQNGLQQIALIDGTINGVDSVGIRWRKTANSQVEILAGLPLVSMSLVTTPDYWPDLQRHFKVYRWDKTAQALVEHGTEVEP